MNILKYLGIVVIIAILFVGLNSCASKQGTVSETQKTVDVSTESLVSQLITGDSVKAREAIEPLSKFRYDSLMTWIGRFDGFPQPDTFGFPIEYKHFIHDSLIAPYYVYVPGRYDPHKPTTLVMWLHGGVSRPQFPESTPAGLMDHPLIEHCEKNNWLLLYPLARIDCLWWNDTGIDHLRWILREVKRQYNVDDNKVICTGFSDGGSGSFHLAMLNPTDYAMFLPYSGHPAVGSLVSQKPTYVPNMRARLVYAANGGADRLYPASKMRPLMKLAVDAGVKLRFAEYDTAGHNYGYLSQEWPLFTERITNEKRNPMQATEYWEVSDLKYNRVDWLEITSLDTSKTRRDWHKEWNHTLISDQVTIGFNIDMEWDDVDKGKGVRVGSVVPDSTSPAFRMGLMEGDIIFMMDTVKVLGVQDVARAKDYKKRGDNFTLKVHRKKKGGIFGGTEDLILQGSFPPPEEYQAFVRGSASGAIEGTRFLDNRFELKASRVKTFSVYINPDVVRLDEPVKVIVNQQAKFLGNVTPDSKFLLEEFVKSRDRKALWVTKVDVKM